MYSQTYGKQQATKTAKLKYFCQMCRKQCYDENGFRCHLNSGHHMKMMRLYNEDPDFYIEQFSQEFETAFMEILKEKYKDQKIGSNKVYEEMIRKVDHVHLNGTKWTKLTDFIQYLIANNKIGFDHSPGDIMIWNLNLNPEKIKYDKVETKKVKLVEKQNALIDKSLEKQIIKGQQLNEQENNNQNQLENQNLPGQETNSNQVQQQSQDQFISFGINFSQGSKKDSQVVLDVETQGNKQWIEESLLKQQGSKENMEKLYQNIKYKNNQNAVNQPQQAQAQQQVADDSPWIKENIVVKIIDQQLNNGKYYGKKGVVKRVIDQFGGLIEIQNSTKEKVIIDQKFLETVIPKIGNQVMILKEGEHCGKVGKLESIHQDNYSGSIYLENEDVLLEIQFDLFSKINSD
ncbi:unnamed protein product (macronuclear) [Paramecium tetraurelia]|uniref:DNA/RNA-binding protein Kin17 WH-like domain-containing protein n=1 Tax=Paramecium tetraurelia TaxID=5888 RepID=A0E2M0_PARTE|nr:uncharacterized protein GSPATT00022709001 [Paramecium tetraurelia]CAK89537.1 unnamed protein product [Paramecium tetraurelia]|eukprot:XP_001456934.1 hypothetical protein (macronuclear) [Paramecium tetraurelia strain d4-2]